MKPLTPRQHEIMHYVIEGYTNQQIAEALGTEVMTVKNNLTEIYKKMGAKNRAHATMLYILFDGRRIERAEDV